ncbi:zinc finger FYVE domain-containing protein 26 homolog [Musca vetustissima]|uniref:zinc finger FYVE domain-containing protein 26 homolog n=1 Tax=Musca vetustissima TaxID=27455 RepID=UPI002AB77674|nr:zinc finger FYVE domain-containing protein 26 homolog [Musca vetustissima]
MLRIVAKSGITSNFLKFLIRLPDDILNEALQGELREKFKHCLDNKNNCHMQEELYLSLLCRKDQHLLFDIMEYLKETQWQYFQKPLGSKEFILYHALKTKIHFIYPMIKELNVFNDITDGTLRNNLIILKLVHEFSTNVSRSLNQLPHLDAILESMDMENVSEELLPVYTLFYKDFKRLSILLHYVSTFPESITANINVEEILDSTNILAIMNKHKLLNSYEEAKDFLESYYTWQQNLALLSLKENETDTLCCYYILSTVCDIITTTTIEMDEYYSSKLRILNSLLRQLKNFELLCQVMEDILKCIYLRWEHFRRDDKQSRFHKKSSGSSYTDDDIIQDSSTKSSKGNDAKANLKSMKTGFICRSKSFTSLCNFLKLYITKKLHSAEYKLSALEIKCRFSNVLDTITDLLWKYEFFEKMERSQDQSLANDTYVQFEGDNLMRLVHFHVDNMNRISSDDEDINLINEYTLSRRKSIKKRRRATFSGNTVVPSAKGSGEDKTLLQHRLRASILSNSVKILPTLDVAEEKSVVPKLLSSSERLAILALSFRQFHEAKQIIENFNLHDTQLNAELQHMEQQIQVKQKLTAIYDNYQQQEKETRNTIEPMPTVELIRNVAAKGFEISKIISIIDNFAQMQRIKQSETIKDLIKKHKQNPQYRFLSQFEEGNLNAVIICDLILSMPFNRDITTSILMVIKRHQAIQSHFNEIETMVEKLQLPSNIGPLHFLENIADCMRVQSDKTIKDLLCDNIYSLKPQKLSREMAKEQIFHEVFHKRSKDLGRCEDLKSLMPQFAALKSKYNYYQRFCNYVQHLTTLVHLRDSNCEYHIEQLLKIDVCDVIGELIFMRNMTPLEIEANVTALNLNLVHVIALNICPEILGKSSAQKRSIPPQKESTILNYIANCNRLLVFLLQGIISNGEHFGNESVAGVNEIHSGFLGRLINMPEIAKLSSLYGGNKVISALRSDHVSIKLLDEIKSKRKQLELLQLEMGIQESRPLKLKRMDCLIVDLIREDPKNIYLSSKIHDIAIRAKLIYENFTKIATIRLAKEIIETTLHHRYAAKRIPQELREQLEVTLADITVYAQVSDVLLFESWPQAYDFGLRTPTTIFERLLQLRLYKLCYKWCKVVKLDQFVPQRKQFLNILLDALLNLVDEDQMDNFELNDYEYLLQILETFFPPDDCKSFLNLNKDKLRCMVLLKFAIEYLERSAPVEEKSYFQNYKISIMIFEQLPPCLRKLCWSLLKYPLLIVEQLIMNAKFEILTKVLTSVRQELTRKDSEYKKLCSFCYDKNGNVYNMQVNAPNTPHKVRFQLGSHESSNVSAFILLNFNLYQKDHFITNDCIDLLLRIYATKALDYQISDTNSTSEPCSQSTCDMQQSLDSLCGAFQMPSQAPTRGEWIRDEDATHCMCCRRSAFSMLIRRHHCRRCGRVVCYSCSTHRMRIPELYEDVEVRICNDCQRLCEDISQRKANRDSQIEDSQNVAEQRVRRKPDERFKWKLSGNITHDKVLREEFCYEHAPSVALCLSILEYHLDKQKCVDLLLFHCRKLEKLMIPNPEVDYELVAKMMNCLALAAKVRGASAEFETIREHSEIIISVVQNGCESLIPPDPLNNHGLRKLADSLVQAERWDLALEVHLKCGLSTAGVMAAHGLSCIRAGCFDTAREKFYHCMPKLTNETINVAITKVIFNPNINASADSVESILALAKDNDISVIKRPHNGPPLLQEILKLIESLPFNKPQPETLQRASIIRSSNTSLASLLSRKKEPYVKRMNEPALNVLNTLANLKRISKGQYAAGGINGSGSSSTLASGSPAMLRKELFRKTRGFEECLYYLLTYGSHTDIIQFLMNNNDLMATLKYYLLQKLDADIFIQHIFMDLLRKGKIVNLIKMLTDFDSRLVIWQPTLLQTCRYLETQNLLNSLYELQILLKDPIRASMTCVKFYTMDCENFQQQLLNAQHLHNARMHLQSELDNAQWEKINLLPMGKSTRSGSRRSSVSSTTGSLGGGGNFFLQMDARSLNAHINTIQNQLEVAKFLAKCEVENCSADMLITEKFLKQLRIETSKSLPTLFDRNPEKIQICILILLCGKNIEEGFGLTYRIIQHYKLPALKVYAASAKYLALNQRLPEIEKLINCITSNTGTNNQDIDEILMVAINSAVNNHETETKTILDSLTKKIHNVEMRISAHIYIGQLKSAYLLANKYERIGDIRKILRQAEATNQVHIKKLCEKKLQMTLSGTSQTK